MILRALDHMVRALLADIRYAFRTFRRAPLAALTITATVALGLGLITVVFALYNALFLRVDAVQAPGELYAIDRPERPGARTWVRFTRPEYEALRDETSVLADVCAMLRRVDARVDGRPVSGALVTGNFFELLGVRAVLGRGLTPADDARLAAAPVVVLSHRGWNKLFAGDPGVIGRPMPVNGVPYEIVGVMPEGFRGLSVVSPDWWMPLGLVGRFHPTYAGREDEVPLDAVIGRLNRGMSAQAATAAMTTWARGRSEPKTDGRGLANIRLKPSQGTFSPDVVDALTTFLPIFFAFGLILMIGCTNVANLLLARAVARQPELAIRLALGASRRRLVQQLFTESLLLALGAAVLGVALSRVLLTAAIHVVVMTMPPEIAEQVGLVALTTDWRVLVFLVACAVLSAFVFGFVPALQATRLELVRTMRGEVMRDMRPYRARDALIAAQVGAAALLLISAAVFLRSAFAAANVDPGLRTSDTVIVEIANESLRTALFQEVMTHPSVAAVAASSPGVMGPFGAARAGVSANKVASAPGVARSPTDRSTRTPTSYQFVSLEYFGVLGIDLANGRGFTAAERTAEAGVAIVSEKAARKLWPKGDALGQVMHLEGIQPAGPKEPDAPEPSSRAYVVIGVARDVGRGRGMFEFSGADVYLPIARESAGTSLTLRVKGDPEQARRALLDRLTRVDPGMGDIQTLRTIAGRATYILRTAFWITIVLGGLALVLTSSGLFSVLSYLVAQRTKDIGVRMAFGATTRDVFRLVLLQLIGPIGWGLLAGAGLAAAVATALLSTLAASRVDDIVRVFDPLAYAASLVVILTACALAASLPAARAARIDPIATLRRE